MSNLYIPVGAVSLDKVNSKQQIRLGLQGPPKVGKTWAALTFPNPIVLNFDRGLGAHAGRADVVSVPFYDDSFVDRLSKRISPDYYDMVEDVKKIRPANRKDALLVWLYKEGSKLSEDQTLIVDGNTKIQAAYHTQYWTEPATDKDGKIKPYEEYKRKISYFSEVAMCLVALRCNVVYICHESPDRDDKGNLNGKIRPLMSGAFVDEMQSHFTDWFRCHTYTKPITEEQKSKAIEFFGCDRVTLKEWCDQFPTQTMYLWQTQSDHLSVCGTSTLVGGPKFVVAHYSTFQKYQRKFPETVNKQN